MNASFPVSKKPLKLYSDLNINYDNYSKNFIEHSNNEYIVNARQTAANRQLLDSINYGHGQIVGFAGGGLISYGMKAIDSAVLQRNKEMGLGTLNANNTVVNNIHITGDISRQTRKEIYQMLPEITTGVNAHNKEQNYR